MKCPLSLITFPGLNSARHPTSHCMHAHTCAHMHTRIQTNSIHVQTPTHTHKFRLSLFHAYSNSTTQSHKSIDSKQLWFHASHPLWKHVAALSSLSHWHWDVLNSHQWWLSFIVVLTASSFTLSHWCVLINDGFPLLLSSLLQISLFFIDKFSSMITSFLCQCCPNCFQFHSLSLIRSHQWWLSFIVALIDSWFTLVHW